MSPFVVALWSVAVFVRAAAGFEVTQCGQVVPAHETGVLAASLACTVPYGGLCPDNVTPCIIAEDCPGMASCNGGAVILQDHATLDLNGKTLSLTPPGLGVGVLCVDRCEVHGPGSISGFGVGILAFTMKRIDVQDVVITGAPHMGAGIYTNSPLRARNVTVTGSLYGITSFSDARTAVLESVVANGNDEIGIYTDRGVRGSDVTANDNGEEGLFLSGFRRSSLVGLTATNNGAAGLKTRAALVLRSSTLTGNNGGGAGIDLATPRRPFLRDTACGLSAAFSDTGGVDVFGPAWGVCAGD